MEGQSDPIVNELSLRLEVLLVEPIEEGGEGFWGEAWGQEKVLAGVPTIGGDKEVIEPLKLFHGDSWGGGRKAPYLYQVAFRFHLHILASIEG